MVDLHPYRDAVTVTVAPTLTLARTLTLTRTRTRTRTLARTHNPNPNPYPNPNPNPRWFVLHPDMWNKEGQLAWRWHPAELQEGQQQSARSGLAARGEKNRTFAGSVCREGGPPASKDYTIALV